jgi:hypothetical protein
MEDLFDVSSEIKQRARAQQQINFINDARKHSQCMYCSNEQGRVYQALKKKK